MIWKLATFNVNGVRARLPQVLAWLGRHSPDLLCLQETKVQDQDFPRQDFENLGYHAAFLGQKSYNGVAVLSRRPPGQVRRGFGDGGGEDEARFIAVLLDGVWVANTYVPQGRDPSNPAFQAKLAFFDRLERWFAANFQPSQPLIWTGDLNVAPEAQDVYDPQRLEGQVGFHPLERQALARVMAWGFSDLFRLRHPQDKQFTFWDYRLPKSFQRNLGWRIDHIMATAPLAAACREVWVDSAPRGLEKPSDHTPMLAELELPGGA